MDILQTHPRCCWGITKDRCPTTTETDKLKWFNKDGTQRYCEEHGPLVPNSWRSKQ